MKSSFSLSGWIFNTFSVSTEGLALYRIFTALFILFFALPDIEIYTFLGQLPSGFFAPPPGPMMLFDGFPSETVLLTMHMLLLVSLVALAVGAFTRLASLSTVVLLLLLSGFIISIGKINHFLLLIVTPLVMSFSGWGAAYSVDALRNPEKKVKAEAWPLALLALILGFMMFTAGFPKILGGWLEWTTQASQGHYIKQFVVRERQALFAPYAVHFTWPVWELVDYGTVIFEVGFLAAIWKARTTKIFVAFAVFFHFGIMLILNISFLPNFIAYAAFLNWTRINNHLQTRVGAHTENGLIRWLPPAVIVLFMILSWLITELLGRQFPNLLASDWGVVGIYIVCCAVPFAAIYLYKELRSIRTPLE